MSAQLSTAGTDSINRIFSVPGRRGIDALLRNARGKQLAGNVNNSRQGGPSLAGQWPTTCFKFKNIRIWQNLRMIAAAQAMS